MSSPVSTVDLHAVRSCIGLTRSHIEISERIDKLSKWTAGSSPTSSPWSTTEDSRRHPRQSSSLNPPCRSAVKDLEAEVGAQLFTRIGHRVRLTAAGSALLEPARQVLRDLETGRAAVAAVTGLLAGSLSLASLPTLAADPMAAGGRFRRHHQGVRVDLAAPEDSDDLFALVESGTCELGLTDAADVPQTLAAISLGTQELVFILPPGRRPPAKILSGPSIAGRYHSLWRRSAHRRVGCWISNWSAGPPSRCLP